MSVKEVVNILNNSHFNTIFHNSFSVAVSSAASSTSEVPFPNSSITLKLRLNSCTSLLRIELTCEASQKKDDCPSLADSTLFTLMLNLWISNIVTLYIGIPDPICARITISMSNWRTSIIRSHLFKLLNVGIYMYSSISILSFKFSNI